MAKQKFLFVTHKIYPYLPVEEPTLGKQMPQKIASAGYEVRTFMPKFGMVNERRNQLHEVIRLSGINIPINNADHPLVIKVASLQPSRIQVYFIDNDDYFLRNEDDEDVIGSNRKDNDERAMYYAHGTADTVKKLKWEPSIVHISGWISSLLPLYIRYIYSGDTTFLGAKVIYSVLPGEVSGGVDPEIFRKLKEEGFAPEIIGKYEGLKLDTDLLHYMAIDNADAVIFHTENPSKQLLDLAAGKGLPILNRAQIDEDGSAITEFYKRLSNEA